MLNALIESTLELREVNEKASYFIAKELALIEVNMLWYPDKLRGNIARLRSLSNHVKITFKNNELSKQLASDIRTIANCIEKKAA